MSVKVTKESLNCSCPHKMVEPIWWTREASDKMGSLLWTESKYKDFEIIIGDRVLPVHKCVLAARSPVFAIMLNSGGFAETTTSQMKFQHFDYETVKTAFEFFYYCSSECFGLNSKSAIFTPIICELLKFGHMYDTKHLMWACLHYIKTQSKSLSNSEKEAIIRSVFDIGDDQVIYTIMGIFGAIGPDFDFDINIRNYNYNYNSYPALGDALLAQDDSFKELKIICDGGQVFWVHKCILALRSPILAQMIEEMAENNDISGQIKPTVFEKVIEFFYTGFIKDEAFEKDPDLLLGLVEFADRFKVEELVSFCLQKITQMVKKGRGGQKLMSTLLQTVAKFGSKKIYHFMQAICVTLGFEPIQPRESYW